MERLGDKDKRRTFRADSGIVGRVFISGRDFSCLICNIALDGCKIAVEGALAAELAGAEGLSIRFDERVELNLEGQVVRIGEAVEGWGISVGVQFIHLDRDKKKILRSLLLGGTRYVSGSSSGVYRLHIRRKRKLAVLLVSGALAVGLSTVFLLKGLREDLESRPEFSIVRTLYKMDRNEREEYWRKASRSEKNDMVRLAEENREFLKRNLSEEEIDFLRKLRDEYGEVHEEPKSP